MLDQTIENKILHQQLELLRKDFAVLFEQRNHMLTYEEAVLTSLYLTSIGTMQFRIFTLKGELAILNEKIRLGQVYFNRNELPDWKEIEAKVKQDFQHYQQKVVDESARLAAAKELLKADLLSNEEAEQLKEVYRILVKRLHPDLNPEQSEAERDLFFSVQAAYQASNVQALNEILLSLNDKQVVPPITTSDLKQQVEQLLKMNGDLQKKIDLLTDSFPFNYRSLLYDEAWIESQKTIFGQQTEALEKEINEKTEYLLLLQSWKPELLH
jgi:hypothetical protein